MERLSRTFVKNNRFKIMHKLIIYTDGGSRGNPGPAAIGVIICDQAKKTIKEYSETIGEATNNEAEYRAVIFAFKKSKQLFGKAAVKEADIEFRMDSELVAKQLQGLYKIEEPNLQPLFLRVWNLKIDFKNAKFKYIPREENKRADKLVKEALDKKTKSQKLQLF